MQCGRALLFRSPMLPSKARISLVVSRMQRSNTQARVDGVTPQVPLTPAGCMREADLYADVRRLSPLQELTRCTARIHGREAPCRALGKRVSSTFPRHCCGELPSVASGSEAIVSPLSRHASAGALRAHP